MKIFASICGLLILILAGCKFPSQADSELNYTVDVSNPDSLACLDKKKQFNIGKQSHTEQVARFNQLFAAWKAKQDKPANTPSNEATPLGDQDDQSGNMESTGPTPDKASPSDENLSSNESVFGQDQQTFSLAQNEFGQEVLTPDLPQLPADAASSDVCARYFKDTGESELYSTCDSLVKNFDTLTALATSWDKDDSCKNGNAAGDKRILPEYGFCDNPCQESAASCGRCAFKYVNPSIKGAFRTSSITCSTTDLARRAIDDFVTKNNVSGFSYVKAYENETAECTTISGDQLKSSVNGGVSVDSTTGERVALNMEVGVEADANWDEGVYAEVIASDKVTLKGEMGVSVNHPQGNKWDTTGAGSKDTKFQCYVKIERVEAIAGAVKAGVAYDIVVSSGKAVAFLGGGIEVGLEMDDKGQWIPGAGMKVEEMRTQCRTFNRNWILNRVPQLIKSKLSGIFNEIRSLADANDLKQRRAYNGKSNSLRPSNVYCKFPAGPNYYVNDVWVKATTNAVSFKYEAGFWGTNSPSYSVPMAKIRHILPDLLDGTISGSALAKFMNASSDIEGTGNWRIYKCTYGKH